MRQTIEALLTGQPVAQWYQAANERWESVLSELDPTNAEAIAKAATSEQMWFEHNCGERWLGQEIMVVAAIGRYFTESTGFDDNVDRAKVMYQGLLDSECSIEIHAYAREMAKIYEELTE